MASRRPHTELGVDAVWTNEEVDCRSQLQGQLKDQEASCQRPSVHKASPGCAPAGSGSATSVAEECRDLKNRRALVVVAAVDAGEHHRELAGRQAAAESFLKNCRESQALA